MLIAIIKTFFSLFARGLRVVFASLLGLCMQLLLLIHYPQFLLGIQRGVARLTAQLFDLVALGSPYYAGYNLLDGDNLIVHMLFVVFAYIVILLVLSPFTSNTSRR